MSVTLKRTCLVSILLWGLVAAGCTKTQTNHRIGLLIPLTGGAASYGQNARQGAELALQQFTSAHPDIHAELVVEDSKGDPGTGVKAVAKLVDLDKVVAVVGCVTSGVTLAAAPIMNEKKIPIISPGASSPKLSQAGEYVFRTWPSDDFEAKRMSGFITSRGVKTLAILSVNNEYGQGLQAAMKTDLSALGGSVQVVDVETFEQGDREMRTQLLRIKEVQPDAIYFVGFPESAVVFGRGYAEAGLHIPVYATSAFEDPQVADTVGNILDGTVYAKPLSESPGVATFRAAYVAAYKTAPGVVSDTSYDAVALVLDAIQDEIEKGTQVSGAAIHNFLLQVKNYSGASGTLSFDQNGDVVKPIGLFVLKDKRFQELSR